MTGAGLLRPRLWGELPHVGGVLRVPADATLHEYRDAAIVDGDDLDSDDAGDSSEKLVAIEERVAALEIENLALRQAV